MHLVRSPRRRRVARLAVLVLAASLLSGLAMAAQTPDTQAPVALREALQAAWQHHPSYRATEAQLAAARARYDAAGRPLYNPQLDLSYDKAGPERTATTGMSLTLDVHGKRNARRSAAEAQVEAATADARLRRRNFVRQWINGWSDLQTAMVRTRIGDHRLALMKRFSELAQKQFAVGDISGLERDLALLARDEAQAQQSTLLIEQADAQARFTGVGGTASAAGLVSLALAGDSLPSVLASGGEGLERLPDWQVAQATMQAAEREVAVARRNRMADPTLGLRGGRKVIGNLTDNVVGVSVSIPLFVRNSYRAEVVAAQAESDAATANAQRVRLELEADRTRAIASYAATQAAWQQWRASRGTDTDRRTALLERMWREGELSTADYLQQLKQTLDTQLAGAELEARLWRTGTDYLAATGQLEAWLGLEGTR
ncbi:MAG: TolC family protein [Xanthomonadaceae bacterium]|nr:TolC family protein [Xanthomonadaceae bacterium]